MVPIADTDDPATLERWSFALGALDIPFELAPADDETTRVRVWVRPEFAIEAHRALTELEVEEGEALRERAEPAAPPRHPGGLASSLLAVWAVSMITLAGFSSLTWWNGGINDAALVRAGEWFRTITAVTLHADMAHLISNSALLVVLGSAAVGRVGPGLTLAVAVLAGAFANVASGVVHGEGFRSIGASGAAFALLGLVAAAAVRTNGHRGARRWLPGVGAALALFAWMGVAPAPDVLSYGPDSWFESTRASRSVDVLAHWNGAVFGFGAGFALPLAGAVRAETNRKLQRITGGATVALLALAWVLALWP